jgi:hypothetical protein
MASVKDAFAAGAAFTVTLASLASSTSGVGRQSTIIDNTSNLYLSALVALAIKAGTTPTANSLIYVYLIRDDNDTPVIDDNGGASDAAITIVNAPLLGVILVNSATSNLVYSRIFDTSQLGPLGPKWGIAIVNSSGVALNASGHVTEWVGRYQTVA